MAKKTFGALQKGLFCLIVVVCVAAFGGAAAITPDNSALPPIILISVDTLRADRLSCYGYDGARTPHIDALAKHGTLFSQASCQVPLTLPSHASLLTSTYPFFTGIQDNSQRLSPTAVTLAGVLKSAGYRTAAFVGSYAMDRRFGLDQGFDLYDSPFDLNRPKEAEPAEIKRWGEDVVKAGTSWIERNPDGPFFVFLHLYDVHKPYDLPPALRQQRHETNYDTQVSYVDGVLGSFWSYLEKRRLLETCLIVFTSDHGEGLGDHGESTHGFFIYQSTLRVPLIFRFPDNSGVAPGRVDEPVSLLDVAPTILQYVGLRRPAEFQGTDLSRVLNPKGENPEAEIYSESLFARNYFGCSALESLRLGRYKFIDAPKPELYDLALDPGEKRNLYEQRRSYAAALRGRLQAVRSRFRADHAMERTILEPEAVAALRSLGYLAVSQPQPGSAEPMADPKDRIGDAEKFYAATLLASSGRLAESNLRFEELKTRFPELATIHSSMGSNHQKQGMHAAAIQDFREALKLDPLSFETHYSLGISLFAVNQLDEAIKELDAALAIAPYYSRAEYLLGTIWMKKGNSGRAREVLTHLLATAPEDYGANYTLGILAQRESRWEESERFLRAALKTDPQSAEAYNALGSVYLSRHSLEQARDAFLEAIGLNPRYAWALYNLGLVYLQQNRIPEAEQQFRKALLVDPQMGYAREVLKELEQRKRSK